MCRCRLDSKYNNYTKYWRGIDIKRDYKYSNQVQQQRKRKGNTVIKQTKEKRKMREKYKNVRNKRENIYIYIFFSNACFLLICYVNRNILISLSHD